MQSVFLGHMDEPFTFIYKGKNAVQVTKHSAYVDVKVENLCQSGVTAHNFTPNSPIAGWLTIEKTTTCEDVVLSDVQAEIRTFLQAVGLANMNMQSGELTAPWYEALGAFYETPKPPITVQLGDNPVTIVKRGQDVDNGDESLLITVVDENNVSYFVGWQYDDSALTVDGFATEVVPSTLRVIPTAQVDAVVPQGNWRLIKWLVDNYNLQIPSYLQVWNDGWNFNEVTFECENGAMIGTWSEEAPKMSFFDDGMIESESAYLNCSGHFTVQSQPTGTREYELYPLASLAEGTTEAKLMGAFNALVMMLLGYIEYSDPEPTNPLPVLTKAIIDNLEDGQSVCVAIKVGNKYVPSYINKVGTTSLAWYSNGCDVDPESGLFTGLSVTETPIAQAEVVENIIGISCDHDDNVQADFATVAGEAIVAFGYEIDETAWNEVPSAMQYRYGY